MAKHHLLAKAARGRFIRQLERVGAMPLRIDNREITGVRYEPESLSLQRNHSATSKRVEDRRRFGARFALVQRKVIMAPEAQAERFRTAIAVGRTAGA